jgi:hypothetical protein
MNTKAITVLVLAFTALIASCATVSTETAGHTRATDAGEATRSGESTSILSGEVQEITTGYAELWSSDNITVKAGIPVRWFVEAAPGSLPKKGMACGKTIKIPGLGWGTDTYNDAEGHLTLLEGKNLVYEFTPAEEGDILFTCWMGSECHYNYIHVTADGAPVSAVGRSSGSGKAHKTAFRYQAHDVNKLGT